MKTPSLMLELPYSGRRISCDAAHSQSSQPEFTIRNVNLESHPTEGPCWSRSAGFSNILLALLIMAMPWLNRVANAQPLEAPNPHTTVVVFADRPMRQGQWAALLSALKTNLAEGGDEAQSLDGTAEFIRGDAVLLGLTVDSAIIVFLHGNCELEPQARRTAFGVPLGWVYRHQGRIEPFAHVDCTRLGQVLGPRAQGVNRDRRATMMADAMARVILHEWIHIATQCPAHAEQGIEKAQFGPADLLYGDSHPALSVRNR